MKVRGNGAEDHLSARKAAEKQQEKYKGLAH
jgi:hypothetical protein